MARVEERADDESTRRAWDVVMAFEMDLCRSLDGRPPKARWMGRARPAAFIAATEDLIVVLTAGQGVYPRAHAINAFENRAFPVPGLFRSRFDLQHEACCVSPARRRSLLAAVVALLLEGETSALLSEARFGPFRWVASLDWLYHWIGREERTWLMARSAAWPERLRQRLEVIAGDGSVRRPVHRGGDAHSQHQKGEDRRGSQPLYPKPMAVPWPPISPPLGLPDAAHYRRLADEVLASPEWLAVRQAPPAVRRRTLQSLSEAALAASRAARASRTRTEERVSE